MTPSLTDQEGAPVLVCPAHGEPVREAADLIGDAFHQGALWVAVPVERLDPDFFRLRTGVAGDFLQKFANYRLRLAVVGDVTEQVRASEALRDLVRECNRGRHCWFVPDLQALGERLSRA